MDSMVCYKPVSMLSDILKLDSRVGELLTKSIKSLALATAADTFLVGEAMVLELLSCMLGEYCLFCSRRIIEEICIDLQLR